MPLPSLVVCAHGTRSPAGAAAVSALVGEVAARRPELQVRAAYVDVQQPDLGSVLAGLAGLAGRDVVVVPLLLSAGFHVHVDIRRAVDAAGDGVRAAGALGPDDALTTILAERLGDVGGTDPGHVVLAAAGSSDPRALQDVELAARSLAKLTGHPVRPGYLSAATPSVADAVARARAEGAARVTVASYLLAPGHVADRLSEVGADLVTAPLLPHPRLAELVVRRYDNLVQTGVHPQPGRPGGRAMSPARSLSRPPPKAAG